MVEFYSFSSELLPEVIAYVKANKRKSRIGSIVGKDPSYFSFGVDGDYSGETMFYTWCSFGKESPIHFPAPLDEN